MPGNGRGCLRFGRFELDSSAQNLLLDGRPVKIQPQPLRVLSVLVEHAGQVVTREQLRDQVWGESTFVEFDQGLNYSIRQIRLALRDKAANPAYIETLRKQGYRFIASVTGQELAVPEHLIANTDIGLAVDLTHPAVAKSALAPLDSNQPSRRTWIWAAGAAVLFAFGAGWMLLGLKSSATARGVDYSPLTNFADSAVAPTLSPDGRMLAFIRGDSTFEGPGDVYVKLLPDGNPVQLTHGGTRKEGPLVFSSDGSRIAFTEGSSAGDVWTVPVLGGDPARLVAHASALSWIQLFPGQPHVMFSSMPERGIHMGVFESTESRSEMRTVYMPAGPYAMAHRSFLSPDGRSVLIVEMDLGSWQPCRLVPFDGRASGTRVGPQPAQCTDAAWSPDGKWMYLSANTGDGYHIWRQRFPDGTPEQVTSGATEEQGLSFAPDGRSFVTSVGLSESTLWVRDALGDRQITSEGFAFLPSFSGDGKTLYYLVRSRASRRFVSGELLSVSLVTGRTARLLPDYLMEHYNVSPDGKRIAFLSVDEAGHSQLWFAPLDASSPPRRLAAKEYSIRVLFDPHGGVLFVGGELASSGASQSCECPASSTLR